MQTVSASTLCKDGTPPPKAPLCSSDLKIQNVKGVDPAAFT